MSERNGCRYCLSAHTVVGKLNGFSDAEMLDLSGGHSADAKLNAPVKLAANLTATKGRVTPATLEAFYAAGYTSSTVVDEAM